MYKCKKCETVFNYCDMFESRLYPAVAKRCDGSVDQVERAMRTAIQRAWTRRDEQIWKMYFAPLPDGRVRKPSNSEFISRIAELLSER